MASNTQSKQSGARVFKGVNRGHTDLGWLASRHSFSFGQHRDPERMGYSALRVLNDDVVKASAGFGEHGHRDMEIISVVLSGVLEHQDSAGNHELLRAGDVQVMSAGSGIRHSESNGSQTDPVHFLQIWIDPDRHGHRPRHERLRAGDRTAGGWFEIASGKPISDGLRINQDATVSMIELPGGASTSFTVPDGRLGYLHVATGSVVFDGSTLSAGDAIELASGASISIDASGPAALIGFDLPPENLV